MNKFCIKQENCCLDQIVCIQISCSQVKLCQMQAMFYRAVEVSYFKVYVLTFATSFYQQVYVLTFATSFSQQVYVL
jgi:hypothetical protein